MKSFTIFIKSFITCYEAKASNIVDQVSTTFSACRVCIYIELIKLVGYKYGSGHCILSSVVSQSCTNY